MTTIINVLRRIMSFETDISFQTNDKPLDFFASVYALKPQYLYYLDRIRFSIKSDGSYLATILYRNRDIPVGDIYTVTSVDQFISIMCQRIGNYKGSLYCVMPESFDIDEAHAEFWAKYSSFYPN